MKRAASIILALATLVCAGCGRCRYSLEMVRSEMRRNPDAAHIDGLEGRLKWNYTTGLELKAFLDVYEAYGGGEIFEYAEAWYDSIIDSCGTIHSYKLKNFNTDHVCPGRSLFYLYDKTGKEKYRMAMDTLYSQLRRHPRTSEGGFWHKKVYPWQMWLDGLYMAQPFYAQYAVRFAGPEQRDSIFADIVNNFEVVAAHTYDPATGLYRHAWDESREMFWCDSETGRSAHAWGRALGWYCMALVDVLDWLPEGFEGRESLIGIFRGICGKLPEYADPQTGMWYQVLDCPGREGNYVEATCSAMFTYSYLKGLRKGYLDESFRGYAGGLYDKLVETFIRKDADGTLSLTDCCAVAGLGGKDQRRGDYDYYINEKRCDNDPKGIGPFIWAALENELKR
ncbi:MAG: glycoside hydrolase family 105 protein [Candidatus Cryptobacteroides sp.]